MPATQLLLWHCAALLHTAPLARSATHVVPLQYDAAVQSVLVVHVVGQLAVAPLQVYEPLAAFPVPAGCSEQVPASPGRLHASHAPPHAPSQQTPSVQNPD